MNGRLFLDEQLAKITSDSRLLWGLPKASHSTASQPHFPRFRVCIFRVFALESPQTFILLG